MDKYTSKKTRSRQDLPDDALSCPTQAPSPFVDMSGLENRWYTHASLQCRKIGNMEHGRCWTLCRCHGFFHFRTTTAATTTSSMKKNHTHTHTSFQRPKKTASKQTVCIQTRHNVKLNRPCRRRASGIGTHPQQDPHRQMATQVSR